MGEFLLSILGFAADGTVVFTRKLKGARKGVGEAVPFVHPNPNRKTKRTYYRILEKFYDPETIVELLKTQNPNVIDQDGKVEYQRRLLGKEMYNLAATGHSFQRIAMQYGGWHVLAVDYAIKKYKNWASEQAKNEPKPEPHIEVADMSTLAYYDPDDQHVTPEHLTAEQIAKREALLAEWN
jgi:hypothetical protein